MNMGICSHLRAWLAVVALACVIGAAAMQTSSADEHYWMGWPNECIAPPGGLAFYGGAFGEGITPEFDGFSFGVPWAVSDWPYGNGGVIYFGECTQYPGPPCPATHYPAADVDTNFFNVVGGDWTFLFGAPGVQQGSLTTDHLRVRDANASFVGGPVTVRGEWWNGFYFDIGSAGTLIVDSVDSVYGRIAGDLQVSCPVFIARDGQLIVRNGASFSHPTQDANDTSLGNIAVNSWATATFPDLYLEGTLAINGAGHVQARELWIGTSSYNGTCYVREGSLSTETLHLGTSSGVLEAPLKATLQIDDGGAVTVAQGAEFDVCSALEALGGNLDVADLELGDLHPSSSQPWMDDAVAEIHGMFHARVHNSLTVHPRGLLRCVTNGFVTIGDAPADPEDAISVYPNGVLTLRGVDDTATLVQMYLEGGVPPGGDPDTGDAGITVLGGRLEGQGKIEGAVSLESGLVHLGAAGLTGGKLALTKDYTQAAGAVLEVPIASDGAGKLTVRGTATLAGTLRLAGGPFWGFHGVGAEFTVLQASGLTGRFDALEVEGGSSGDWTMVYTPTEVRVVQAKPDAEYNALVALYNSTGGPNWTENANWLTSNSAWHGVTVSGGHVTQLRLSSNRLTGTIPAELGNLTGLSKLYLSDNQLTGPIPPALGNLTKLKELYLSFNLLTGPIPSTLGNLTELWTLSLSVNQLTGPIPDWLGGMTSLYYLYLRANQFSGPIPPELGTLTNLWGLYLSDNQLTGEIPPALSNLTELSDGTGLRLRYNGLSTSDSALASFVLAKSSTSDGVWRMTQTVAPAGVAADPAPGNGVTLSWTPISYAADAGYYEVGVGTTPGGPYSYDPVNRTIGKSASGLTVSGLPLGGHYFVVRTVTLPHANNQNTVVSPPSAEASATVGPQEAISIGAAKLLVDEISVKVQDVVVTSGTGQLEGVCYVEEPDRSGAIAVVTGVTLNEGDAVDVMGLMTTLPNGERALSAAAVAPAGSSPFPRPCIATLRDLASAPWHYVVATGAGQCGVSEPAGHATSTVGLFVETCGRVVSMDADYLLINDGSFPSPTGVRVERRSAPPGVQLLSYIRVRGISSIRNVGGTYQLLIRPRKTADVIIEQ